MKRVQFIVSAGTGFEQVTGTDEYTDEEFQNAVDSGEIFAHAEEWGRDFVEYEYRVIE